MEEDSLILCSTTQCLGLKEILSFCVLGRYKSDTCGTEWFCA